MLSQNKVKYIQALWRHKGRSKQGLFIAEGHKLVSDYCTSIAPQLIVCTEAWAKENQSLVKANTIICSLQDIKKVSQLSSPPPVLGVFSQWKPTLEIGLLKNKLSLVLDKIQDPGNMGNIIRIAHWFGIKHIICAQETVDVYNPKVVQGSMGALAHVKVYYTTLEDLLPQMQTEGFAIYGAFMEGETVFNIQTPDSSVLVMGNEGQGISPNTSAYIQHRVSIPPHDPLNCPESLNVASATAILCAQFTQA